VDIGPDLMEYLKELRLWGYKNEAEEKLLQVARYIDDPLMLSELFEEWKEKDSVYEYMCYGRYSRHAWYH
jgi:hypothetical protein